MCLHSGLELGMLIEEATTFIIIDKAIHNTINIILNKGTKAGLKQSINRWLIAVSQDSVARATIAWYASVLVAHAKMTQVTLRKNVNEIRT